MWAWLLGAPGENGPRGASLWQKITFSWPAPLIAKGWREPLGDGDASGCCEEVVGSSTTHAAATRALPPQMNESESIVAC